MADEKDKNLPLDGIEDEGITDPKYIVGVGVNVPWLSQFLNMDRKEINRKLSGCPHLPGRGKTSGKIYEPEVALRYLIEPVADLEAFLKKLKPKDVPFRITKAYFDGQAARDEYQLKRNLLFHTDDVLDILVAVLKIVNDESQATTAIIEKTAGLAPKQERLLSNHLKGMNDSIYKTMLELSQHRTTPSLLADFEENADKVKPKPKRKKLAERELLVGKKSTN